MPSVVSTLTSAQAPRITPITCSTQRRCPADAARDCGELADAAVDTSGSESGRARELLGRDLGRRRGFDRGLQRAPHQRLELRLARDGGDRPVEGQLVHVS